MELLKTTSQFDFLGLRAVALTLSALLLVLSIVALATRGLDFGIDFTGGTLIEMKFAESIEIDEIREVLSESGFGNAIVQYFGTSKDIMVRLPADENRKAAEISGTLMEAVRRPYSEVLTESLPGTLQQCLAQDGAVDDCQVQMQRIEFVGPQVGAELAEKGGLAMLYALIGILIYVAWRFEWRFAVSSVIALVHDVLMTLGVFAIFQFDFSLAVLAAILAVIGYSLNDTIVVFDRIRENFRKLRRGSSTDVINLSINQTLPRTLLTSATTGMVVLTLLLLGGEVIRSFAIALCIGIIVGTYSSIFVASPMLVVLGISREDMLPVSKEGADPAPTP